MMSQKARPFCPEMNYFCVNSGGNWVDYNTIPQCNSIVPR